LRRAAPPPASNPSQFPLPAPSSGSGEGGRGEGQTDVMPQRAPNTSGKNKLHMAYNIRDTPIVSANLTLPRAEVSYIRAVLTHEEYDKGKWKE